MAKRVWTVRQGLGFVLCVLLLGATSIVHLSCDQCNEDNKEKCDTSCERHALCDISYSYNESGTLLRLARVCRWVEAEDSTRCGKCSNQVRNADDKMLSQNCYVCNVCNSEFECLTDSDCENKSATPYCQAGVCSSCRNDGDCKDANRPICTQQGCACAKDSDCGNNVDATPVCIDDKDASKPKLCGCTKDEQCKNPEQPVCVADRRECGCGKDSDCPNANRPQCEDNRCVICRCPSTQPRRPFCLKKSDGAVSCVECVEDSDCRAPTSRCNPTTHTCVACQRDQDCTESSKPSCDADTGLCASCRCPTLNPDKPVCLKKSDNTVACVACLKDTDCSAPTPKCNTQTNVCEAACSQDSDCGGDTPFCDQGQCVACRDVNDCTDPQLPRCVSGSCQCLSDKDCPGDFPVCSSANRCVECERNGDCTAGFPVCSSSGICELLPCEPAKGGAECKSVPDRPNCRKLGRRYVCVGCTKDNECQSDETCDLSKFICLKK